MNSVFINIFSSRGSSFYNIDFNMVFLYYVLGICINLESERTTIASPDTDSVRLYLCETFRAFRATFSHSKTIQSYCVTWKTCTKRKLYFLLAMGDFCHHYSIYRGWRRYYTRKILKNECLTCNRSRNRSQKHFLI